MPQAADSWTTQQLVEFLAAVSGSPDVDATITVGVEAAAEALDAEVAALIAGNRVKASIGFPAGQVPADSIVAAASNPDAALEVPGVGNCDVSISTVEGHSKAGEEEAMTLLIARWGDPLSPEEQDLFRGMGRVLGLALQSVAALASVRERQRLLERLSRLQRSIASRVDLQDVLDSIVAGAAELIGDEISVLRRVTDDDPTQTEIVSALEPNESLLAEIRRTAIDTGIGGQAILSRQLVAFEDYTVNPMANPPVAASGLKAAMAAPIFERGEVVGSLMVGTRERARTYSAGEREVLEAFAEHAGLALNDARAVAETIHQAFHDSLTGLPNRALFLDRLEHSLARARRSERGVSVLYIDLDGFKTVNDSLGHAVGDELLVAVGERIATIVRDADTAARFGGDEFAVLLDEYVGAEIPAMVARRVLDAFKDPFEVRGRPIYVSASIGISAGIETAEHLLRNADLAMYRAKSRGKGRFELFEPGMHAEAVKRLELEVDLKQALERREFVLHYQPVVDLRSGQIVAAEALSRWQHPTRGLLPPGEFIGLAEESGHIVELGRWAVESALGRVREWDEAGILSPGFEISVNLSGVQLEHPQLVKHIADALTRTGVPPERLVLEITETALMSDTELNIRKLNALKEIGVKLAVDDFGTGYSSLQYLRQFPIDMLKIAKSFVDGLSLGVDDVASGAEGGALVRAIIDLAETFGVRVIAEGVEEQQQRRRLIEMGCYLAQGFLFSRPVEAADATSQLSAGASLGPPLPAGYASGA
jgi:diguanylate cyclase (GGDEF)-like protein